MASYIVKLKDGRSYKVEVKDPETAQEAQKSYLSRVGSTIKKEGLGIGESIVRGSEMMQQGNPKGALAAGFGATGGAVRAGASPLTEAIAPGIQKGIGKVSDNAFVQSFASWKPISKMLDNVDFGVGLVKDWADKNPDDATIAKDAFDTLMAILPIKGAKGVKTSVVNTAKKTADTVVSNIPKPPPGTVAKVGNVLEKTGQFIDDKLQEASRIPSRMATNSADSAAKQAAINKLPSQTARQAAQDGIDLLDIKDISSIPKNLHGDAKALIDNVTKFARREVKDDPIEAVGRPIVSRLQELDTARKTIGKQLGEVAETIGKVTTEELVKPVVTRLRKVPGLSKLMIRKGKLYFKNTTLASGETAVDRALIQRIFNDAIKNGTGNQKHLLRQELFKTLGAAKKAGAQLTDTADQAVDAIRGGMADVLGVRNVMYKSLSNEARKTIQPILKLNKMLKTAPGDTVDALKMNAGLLARRLTSTSMSRIDVERVLKMMDTATKAKGTLAETTASLQKLYNILGKHYDIAPKTGFQGLVKSGVEGANSVSGFILETGRKMAGETNAVRQKALEAFLKEVFK